MNIPDDIREAYHALPPKEQERVRQLALERYRQLMRPRSAVAPAVRQANQEIRRG